MIESIETNWPWIILGLVALLLVLQLRFSHAISVLSKHFYNQKVTIKAHYNHDMTTGTPSVMLNVHNRNVNDLKLIGLGFIYKDQTIDYFKTAVKEKGTEKTNQLIIDARDAIKIPIPVNSLKNTIHNLNDGTKRIKPLYVFATDVGGTQSQRKATTVRRMVKKLLKRDRLERKEALKARKKEERATIREEKRIKKRTRRKNMKQRFSAWKMKIRNLFAKKKKKNNE